jgi:hypothetical protein
MHVPTVASCTSQWELFITAVRIGSASGRVIASPTDLARHGTPQRPADVSSHACLRFSRFRMEVRSSWPFGSGSRSSEVQVSGRLVSDDVAVLHTAAEQGLEGADPA